MSNIIKFDQFNITTEVKFEDGEFWLTQKQLAELFGIDVKTISFHLVNMKEDGELPDSSVLYYQIIAESSFSGQKEVAHYNQDVAYDLGFRVRNSALAKKFRSYTKEILKRELKEQSNPSLTLDRGIDNLKKAGASDAWIAKRVESKVKRNGQTGALWERGVTNGTDIAICTNAGTEGMTGHKDKAALVKYLTKGQVVPKKSKPAKEYMNEVELGIQSVADDLSRQMMEKRNAQGFKECKACCYDAGAAMKSAWDIAQQIKGA